jgi:hypothetical protein
MDTRPGELTIDHINQGTGRLQPGSITEIQIAGRGNIPNNATAAVLNATAIFPTDPGFLTIYPCGGTPPTTSNVNYQPGQVVPNTVITKLDNTGKACIYTLANTDVIIDVNGYFPAG